MQIRLILTGLIALIITIQLSAQNVSISIDGSDPNNNAMLDVKNAATGAGKGILIPRLTEDQRTSSNASLAGGLLDDDGNLRGGEAAQGLLVYQTDGTEGFYYNTSTSTTPNWSYLGSGSGTVTSVTASSPLTGGTITSTGSIGINKADASTDGYLDKSDYSNFNTAYTSTNSATNANTASTIVKRDSSGNFSAGTISANLTGDVTGDLTGNADTATSATNVTGTVAIANGGTGATDAGNARSNLGLGSIATQAANSVDIDGGAIDGVTIGANSAGAGTFSSVTAAEANAYYLGTTKVLHRGTGALTGTLVIGNGGENLSHTSGDDGFYNIFVGIDAGTNCEIGESNIAIGYKTLEANTSGDNNIAIGTNALNKNTTANSNIAIGEETLYENTTGNSNIALGKYTLAKNTTGNSNVSLGYYSLSANTTGYENTSIGVNGLCLNTTGLKNTASGKAALFFNTTGNYNTATGFQAGYTNATGSNNTFIGYNADAGSDNLSNAMALGNGASVDADNKVVIGNSSVTTIGGYAVWSNYSDRREKKEITDCNLGLEFVEKLRPVNFKYKNQDKLCNGFIAQEVEDVCKETNVEFGGLTKPQNANGRYMLSYSEFVVPLVNAVKELKNKNDKLEAENKALKAELESEIKAIKQKLGM